MPGLVTSTFRLHECQSFGLECWDAKGRAVAGGGYGTLDAFMAGMKFACRQPGVVSWTASAVTKDGRRVDASLEARKEFEYRLDDEAAFNRDVLALDSEPERFTNAGAAKPDRPEDPSLLAAANVAVALGIVHFIQEVLYGPATIDR